MYRSANEDTILWPGQRTSVHVGRGAWRAAIADAGTRTLLVLDASFAAARFPLVESIHNALGLPADRIQVIQPPATVERVESLAALIAATSADRVVAIGGSGILDTTKLACQQYADPRTLPTVRARGARHGLVELPTATGGQPRRILIPTTIGSAAELRPYAVVRLRGHRRLVHGPQLPPETAVLDSMFTASLPRQLLIEGISAALLRFIGPCTDGTVRDTLAEAATKAAIRLLVTCGIGALDGDFGPAEQLLAARANAARELGLVFRRDSLHIDKCRVVASELATHLGVHPVAAVAALLPVWWRRIEDGDSRFGDRARLHKAWHWIHSAGHGRWPADPSTGIAELTRDWGLDGQFDGEDDTAGIVAARTIRFWGGKGSPFTGIPADDIGQLIGESLGVRSAAGRAGHAR
ncbi:iron-containing alcohol dehydrogenase [Amycolatopsis cihanbeyliensis]|uniref:NADP-dependent alcohol dehydrogenase n=1 Tax=Amycolatopsis cihanbeyliensis TaxID=1128664 RepID=A0A542DBW1_AMYCI|nr:iron-containing alcohol dehydrogenase [Amycolatopsis cihanbeyliensis]TQJ00554.1 NADP-dependent alcohol dehydrogenase [Amycolatopsis cihanbeyliensis]